jgi:GTP-binding protein
MTRKPMVALVGRPNVGKSTLFNRLIGERRAVTDPIPGTTRDRIQAEAEWGGLIFDVVDTGGIEVYQPRGNRDISPLAEGSIAFVPLIKSQALQAIEVADAIIMVVDSTHGITGADEEIAEILRRNRGKPIFVAANKTDNPERIENAVEFYGLGLGEVFPISAYHGLGVGDLLDAVIEPLKKIAYDELEDEADILRIAIVGRPNVGKSSLLNLLLGEERAIVSSLAGTTRDAIDTEITWHKQQVRLIDTAGIRRRGKIEPGVEKYSVLRTMRAIERSDVVLLLINATEGIAEQDLHIAGYINDAYRSVVLVVNKWDTIEKDEHTMNEWIKDVRAKFDFLPNPPILFISALKGQRIHQVLATAHRVWEGRFHRISTGDLNRLLRAALQKHPPPTKGTKRLKVLYLSQVAVNPPVFLFHVNDTRLVHFTYKRYLENQLRNEYAFEGTPIRLSFRPREGMLENQP